MSFAKYGILMRCLFFTLQVAHQHMRRVGRAYIPIKAHVDGGSGFSLQFKIKDWVYYLWGMV